MQNKKPNTIISIIILIAGALFLWFLYNQNAKVSLLEQQNQKQEFGMYSNINPNSNPEPVPNPNPSPNPNPNQTTTTIYQGQEFTAHVGEKFTISGLPDDSFEITGFYNHPCPPGGQCIWSGQDVFYKISYQGKVYEKGEPLQNPAGSPYSVVIKDSDYKTYAKVVYTIAGKTL